MSNYLSCNFITRMRQLGIEIEDKDHVNLSNATGTCNYLESNDASTTTIRKSSGSSGSGEPASLG